MAEAECGFGIEQFAAEQDFLRNAQHDRVLAVRSVADRRRAGAPPLTVVEASLHCGSHASPQGRIPGVKGLADRVGHGGERFDLVVDTGEITGFEQRHQAQPAPQQLQASVSVLTSELDDLGRGPVASFDVARSGDDVAERRERVAQRRNVT